MAASYPSPYEDECDICMEFLNNPRALTCGHVFCLDCLEKLERKKTITCPQCRKDTEIPVGLQVKHLPKKLPKKSTTGKYLSTKCELTLVKSWEVKTDIISVNIDEKNILIYAGTNGANDQIQVYTFAGELVNTIQHSKENATPKLAIDTKRGLLLSGYVSDIKSFHSDGERVGIITCPKVKFISNLVYEYSNDRYVVADRKAHCLAFISPSTESMVRSAPAEEARPTKGGGRNMYMAASKSPHSSLLATLDSEKGLVKLYDGEGNFIRSYGGTGSGFGKLSRPSGICFDHQDRILVSDMNNHRLVRLSHDAGDESQEWEVIMDTSTLELGHPRMVDVTEDGLVAMAMYTTVKNGPFNLTVFSGYE